MKTEARINLKVSFISFLVLKNTCYNNPLASMLGKISYYDYFIYNTQLRLVSSTFTTT